MLIFAAETSCDETSICLMDNGRIVDHMIYSQEIHNKFGGVIPELASRSHLQILQKLTYKLFSKNRIEPNKIDIFAATCGPGLIGSLLVGSTFIKSLSIGYNKPFIPINHLQGHVLSTSFNNKIVYPHLVLLVTGGHTQIYIMENDKKIKLLGQTLDDALGEAFDKTAKILGLNYPGGVEIENCANYGDETVFVLPKPMIKTNDFNFSFSGIKTHVNLITKKNTNKKNFINDLCASFQKTISEILISKIDSGLKILKADNINIKSISIVGGVANNKYLRNKIEQFFKKNEIDILYPINQMMGDNAAMIAWACFRNYSKDKINLHFKAQPRMKIGDC